MKAPTHGMTTLIGMLAIKYRKNKLNKISSKRTIVFDVELQLPSKTPKIKKNNT